MMQYSSITTLVYGMHPASIREAYHSRRLRARCMPHAPGFPGHVAILLRMTTAGDPVQDDHSRCRGLVKMTRPRHPATFARRWSPAYCLFFDAPPGFGSHRVEWSGRLSWIEFDAHLVSWTIAVSIHILINPLYGSISPGSFSSGRQRSAPGNRSCQYAAA